MLCAKVWTDESSIQKLLFNESASQQPMDLWYLDIPVAYKPTFEGFEFIDALLEGPEESSLKLFGLKSVQIIIDNHHAYWFWKNILFIGLPMTLQLMIFWYWSNIVMPNLDKDYDTFEKYNTFC